MNNKTNLEVCKELAIEFLNFEPEPIDCPVPLLIQHPYISNAIVSYKDDNGQIRMANILEEPDKFEYTKSYITQKIKKGSLDTIFALMLNKYHLAYLKYAKPFMSKEDFEKYLAYAWVASENPNQDVNVSINEFIQWFKNADRNNLMEEDELEYYNNLPDEVNVYRGIAVGRAEQNGLSWTCNYDTAKWFENRFNTENQKGYIIKGTIEKNDIFAYFNGRNEDEILCNSKKIKNIERLKEN